MFGIILLGKKKIGKKKKDLRSANYEARRLQHMSNMAIRPEPSFRKADQLVSCQGPVAEKVNRLNCYSIFQNRSPGKSDLKKKKNIIKKISPLTTLSLSLVLSLVQPSSKGIGENTSFSPIHLLLSKASLAHLIVVKEFANILCKLFHNNIRVIVTNSIGSKTGWSIAIPTHPYPSLAIPTRFQLYSTPLQLVWHCHLYPFQPIPTDSSTIPISTIPISTLHNPSQHLPTSGSDGDRRSKIVVSIVYKMPLPTVAK